MPDTKAPAHQLQRTSTEILSTFACLLTIFILIQAPQIVTAQTPRPIPTNGVNTGNTDSGRVPIYYLGFKLGSFLPFDIVGVRDLLPVGGIKFGHSYSENVRIEYDLDGANAKGVSYYNFYLSIRYNFSILDALPLFFTFGGDVHYYKLSLIHI